LLLQLGDRLQAVLTCVDDVDSEQFLFISESCGWLSRREWVALDFLEGSGRQLLLQLTRVVDEDVLEDKLEIVQGFGLAKSHASGHRCLNVFEEMKRRPENHVIDRFQKVLSVSHLRI
jgi:hypothetical protein